METHWWASNSFYGLTEESCWVCVATSNSDTETDYEKEGMMEVLGGGRWGGKKWVRER